MSKRKPSQKQLQNQLVSAYNKAYKVYSDLNKAGYNFTKTHEKVMSFERLTKKLTSGKITKKDVQFYKDKAKKTNQYKGAKSYTDLDTGKTMSVKQGRLSERRKKVASMSAKAIIGICLVVFIVAGLVFLKLRNRK